MAMTKSVVLWSLNLFYFFFGKCVLEHVDAATILFKIALDVVYPNNALRGLLGKKYFLINTYPPPYLAVGAD